MSDTTLPKGTDQILLLSCAMNGTRWQFGWVSVEMAQSWVHSFSMQMLMATFVLLCWMTTSSRSGSNCLTISFVKASSYVFGGRAQDSAPPYQLVAVRNRLLDTFRQRVIALHLPEDWPPRSPDLMPCDYFFLDFLKHKVYQTPPQDINDLRERIRHEANLLRESPELVRREVL